MILDLIYGGSKPLEKASYCTKSNRRKQKRISRVSTELISGKSSSTRDNICQIIFIFSATSWLVSAGAGVTCFRDSREPISALDVMTYVTPIMVRNFWL